MAKYGRKLPQVTKNKLYNLNRQIKELDSSHTSITPSSIRNRANLKATEKRLAKQLYNLRQERDIKDGNIRKAQLRANRNPSFRNARDRQLLEKGSVKQGTFTTKLGYQTSIQRADEFKQLAKKVEGKMSQTLKGIERRKNKELYDLISGRGVHIEGLPSFRTSKFTNVLPQLDFVRDKQDFKEKKELLENLLTSEGRKEKINKMYSPNLERASAFFDSFESTPTFSRKLAKLSPQARIILNLEMQKYFEALNYQSGDSNEVSDTPMSSDDIQEVLTGLYKRMDNIQEQVNKKYIKKKSRK